MKTLSLLAGRTIVYMYKGFESTSTIWLNGLRVIGSIIVSKMHSNEAILFFSYKQVKHDYSLPCAYAVFCGWFKITVN